MFCVTSLGSQHAEFVGNHPNAFFDASVRYYNEKEASKAGTAGQTNKNPTTQNASSPSAAKSAAVANPGPAAAPGFSAPPTAPAVAAAGQTQMEE